MLNSNVILVHNIIFCILIDLLKFLLFGIKLRLGKRYGRNFEVIKCCTYEFCKSNIFHCVFHLEKHLNHSKVIKKQPVTSRLCYQKANTHQNRTFLLYSSHIFFILELIPVFNKNTINLHPIFITRVENNSETYLEFAKMLSLSVN